MVRKIVFLLALFSVTAFADHLLKDQNSAIFGKDLLINIAGYGKEGSLNLGVLFTYLQSKVFGLVFLGIAFGVPAAFALHYFVVGPMIFSHDRKKIFVFNVFHRTIHWLAGFSFIALVPTGFIMIFASSFGGGDFVIACKQIHAMATVVFAIAVLPMFFMWVKDMLPIKADLKWLMIMGGYLNKRKEPIPAHKFNAGQKMWFWVCTLGGILMILTGAIMYFQDFHLPFNLGMSQIDLLRLSAIMHNVMGMAVVALFFTHIYMSVFAIKGAIHSMISGYKEEEEVEILHSLFYKELKEKKVI